MANSAITVHLSSEEHTALQDISAAEHRPLHHLVAEVVRAYLRSRRLRERTLEESLNTLRAYREQDPDFQRAVASFGPAEATAGEPLEETVLRGPQTGAEPAQGPVQTRIHELLRA